MDDKIIVIQLLWLFVTVYTASGEIKCSREELTDGLKFIFGGKGALSDFVFYDKKDLNNVSQTQPRPRNELRDVNAQTTRNVNNTATKNRANEKLLLRVVEMLRKGENTELIDNLVEQFVKMLSNGGNKRFPWFYYKPSFNFELKLINGKNKIRRRSRRNRKNSRRNRKNSRRIRRNGRRNRRRSRRHKKRIFKNINRRDDVFNSYDNDDTTLTDEHLKNNYKEYLDIIKPNVEDEELSENLDENDYIEQLIEDEIEAKKGAGIYQSILSFSNKITNLEDEKAVKRGSEKIPRKSLNHKVFDPRHLDRGNFHQIRQVSPVEDYDFNRMRRASAPFTPTGRRICDEEGLKTEDNTVVLCKTCYNDVDFGSTIIPQFAKSVQCDSAAPLCLRGNGKCIQKVVFYTFQQQKPGSTDVWSTFEQPLNVSCECQCQYNSDIHLYFVGNSN